jgi:AcrR family transcriptional regulator
MVTRAVNKQHTRQRLIDAALTLTQGGRSLASLALREVTRQAGVSPTAFYRHFRDLSELGLSIVDDTCLSLRRMLREVRRATPRPDIAVKGSVANIFTFLTQHHSAVEFVVRERVGGPTHVRQAIAHEIRYFVGELAHDLRPLPSLAKLSDADLQLVASLLVNTVITAITEAVDAAPPTDVARAAIGQRAVQQLRMILVGARHWDPARGQDERLRHGAQTRRGQ